MFPSVRFHSLSAANIFGVKAARKAPGGKPKEYPAPRPKRQGIWLPLTASILSSSSLALPTRVGTAGFGFFQRKLLNGDLLRDLSFLSRFASCFEAASFIPERRPTTPGKCVHHHQYNNDNRHGSESGGVNAGRNRRRSEENRNGKQ